MESYNKMPTTISHKDGLVDPKAHVSNWFSPSNPEPTKAYFEPPPSDFPTSLFDPSEQQFLSGFFDNLVEEKNGLFPGLDLCNFLTSFDPNPSYSSSINKPSLGQYSYNQIPCYDEAPTNSFLSTSPQFKNPRGFNRNLSQMNNNQNNYKSAPYYGQNSSPPLNASGQPLYPNNSSSLTPGSVQNELKQSILSQLPPSLKNNNVINKIEGEQCVVREEQKRANHIASEQKRRDLIRKCFEEMTNLVTGSNGTSCSKAVLLKRAADYIEELKNLIDNLQQEKQSKLNQLGAQ